MVLDCDGDFDLCCGAAHCDHHCSAEKREKDAGRL